MVFDQSIGLVDIIRYLAVICGDVEINMDYVRPVVIGVEVLMVFSFIRCFYLYEKLIKYILKQYPEVGAVIMRYRYQWYPWCEGP